MAEEEPETDVLESWLRTLRNIVGFFSLLSFVLAISSAWAKIPLWLPWQGWLIIGILLAVLTFFLSGLRVVQAPERWVIERFGKPVKILEPGLRWMIPVIEVARAKPKVYEQPIELFASQPKIDFRDGSATLTNPRIYVELSEEKEQIVKAIYRVKNWSEWAVDTVETIIRGFLNSLSITEALDEGGARGNLIDRLKERPEITERQLKDVSGMIPRIDEKIEELKKEKKDVRLLESEKARLEEKKLELETRLSDQKNLKKAFENFEKESRERGISKIHRIVVAEFGLPEEIITARGKVHEEEKRAAAALSEAIRETTLRTESIMRTKEKFVEAGFSEEDALRKAYELDILETLATTGSLFLTGAGRDLSSIIARASAIFAEVSERREKTLKKRG